MTKSIQQQCAERLYELLPHKKELEFGCHVLSNWRHGKMVGHLIVGNRGGKISVVENRFKGRVDNLSTKSVYPRDVSVIGHPLRLADVLSAISEKEKFNAILKFMAVNGGFYDNGVLIAHYELSKDNILEQSDETCLFLLELLK